MEGGDSQEFTWLGDRIDVFVWFRDGAVRVHGMFPTDRVSQTPLENFMVIALEPGVYGPDQSGARVENLFIVTPSGGVELREAFGVAR